MAELESVGLPIVIGFVLSCVFFGVSIGQAIVCFRWSYRNGRKEKYLTALSLCIDLVHTSCLTDVIWRDLVMFHNRTDKVLLCPTTLAVSLALTYVMTFIVQSYYSYRVWRLSEHNKIITGTMVISATAHLGTGIGVTVTIARNGAMSAFHSPPVQRWASAENALSILCDFLITFSMVYFLNRKRTGFKRTETLINKLIFYSVNLGLLSSIVVALELIVYLAAWKSWTFFVFNFIISKSYVNSLLAMLNTGHTMGKKGSEIQSAATFGHVAARFPSAAGHRCISSSDVPPGSLICP